MSFQILLLCFSRPSWPVFWGTLPLMVMISVRNRISSCLKKTRVDRKAGKHLGVWSTVTSHQFITFWLKNKIQLQLRLFHLLLKFMHGHTIVTINWNSGTCTSFPHETRFFYTVLITWKSFLAQLLYFCYSKNSRLFSGEYHEGYFRGILRRKPLYIILNTSRSFSFTWLLVDSANKTPGIMSVFIMIKMMAATPVASGHPHAGGFLYII